MSVTRFTHFLQKSTHRVNKCQEKHPQYFLIREIVKQHGMNGLEVFRNNKFLKPILPLLDKKFDLVIFYSH